MKENNPTPLKEKSPAVQSVVAHLVLILLAFLCLFFFYILIINATRCHAELQRGFSALPGTHFIENLIPHMEAGHTARSLSHAQG